MEEGVLCFEIPDRMLSVQRKGETYATNAFMSS